MRFLCNRLCGLNEFRCCDRISKIYWRRNKAILEVTLSARLHVEALRGSGGGDGFAVDYLWFFAGRTRNCLDVSFCHFAIIIVLRYIDIPYNAIINFNWNIIKKLSNNVVLSFWKDIPVSTDISIVEENFSGVLVVSSFSKFGSFCGTSFKKFNRFMQKVDKNSKQF